MGQPWNANQNPSCFGTLFAESGAGSRTAQALGAVSDRVHGAGLQPCDLPARPEKARGISRTQCGELIHICSGGLGAFEENGPRSAWDYFRLGALLHYVADAFTGPHNGFWTGNLVGHAVYELKLNDALINELAKAKRHPANEGASCPLSGYFAAVHRRYCMEEKGVSTDSLYIVRVCSVLLHRILRGSGEFRETKETGVAHGR